jgi:hypothetical protein
MFIINYFWQVMDKYLLYMLFFFYKYISADRVILTFKMSLELQNPNNSSSMHQTALQ